MVLRWYRTKRFCHVVFFARPPLLTWQKSKTKPWRCRRPGEKCDFLRFPDLQKRPRGSALAAVFFSVCRGHWPGGLFRHVAGEKNVRGASAVPAQTTLHFPCRDGPPRMPRGRHVSAVKPGQMPRTFFFRHLSFHLRFTSAPRGRKGAPGKIPFKHRLVCLPRKATWNQQSLRWPQ